MARKYSVEEIDDLRDVCERMFCYGTYNWPKDDGIVGRSYSESELYKCREEMVRTHMIAGHVAQDLLNSEKQ